WYTLVACCVRPIIRHIAVLICTGLSSNLKFFATRPAMLCELPITALSAAFIVVIPLPWHWGAQRPDALHHCLALCFKYYPRCECDNM
ncbi:hypothetical protein K438DRAFT_2066961, partial [Mycena galopus ATCC 62051]